MKVIDFLPADYLVRRYTRRANWVCAAIGAGAVLVVGAVVGLFAIRAMGVTHMRAVVDQKFDEASQQIQQMKDLESRKAGLLRKVELSASLLERVPRSYILAHLTNDLPSNVSLTTLTMNMVDQEVPVSSGAVDMGDADAPAPTKKSKASKKDVATVKVKRLQFTLGGLASTDVEVADYIARLSSDPIFEEVDLKFSEEFPYDEHTRMRRFEIVLRLSPKAAELLEQKNTINPGSSLTALPVARGES